jgi:DeoR/GlpR family transcriptional regulator of sugar metabolism
MVVLSPRRRRQEIVRLASTNGLASVDDLSDTFAVSPSTIRRDLAKLEADGQIARTYGGAIASYAHAESSLRQRMGEEYEAKRAIAHSAAGQIDVDESIFLDAGSTVAALAREIRSRSDLTITTTSLIVLNELSRSEHPTINALGGTLRMISQGFVGPLAEAALENLSFDRAFLGADSVDAELGICEADPHQTRLRPCPRPKTRPPTLPCLDPTTSSLDPHHQRRQRNRPTLQRQRCPRPAVSRAELNRLPLDGWRGPGQPPR